MTRALYKTRERTLPARSRPIGLECTGANSKDPAIANRWTMPKPPTMFHDHGDGSARLGSETGPSPIPDDFDAEQYLKLNPDVADAKVDAAVHYAYEGAREGRRYKPA